MTVYDTTFAHFALAIQRPNPEPIMPTTTSDAFTSPPRDPTRSHLERLKEAETALRFMKRFLSDMVAELPTDSVPGSVTASNLGLIQGLIRGLEDAGTFGPETSEVLAEIAIRAGDLNHLEMS